jgi:hypothetical protein
METFDGDMVFEMLDLIGDIHVFAMSVTGVMVTEGFMVADELILLSAFPCEYDITFKPIRPFKTFLQSL